MRLAVNVLVTLTLKPLDSNLWLQGFLHLQVNSPGRIAQVYIEEIIPTIWKSNAQASVLLTFKSNLPVERNKTYLF